MAGAGKRSANYISNISGIKMGANQENKKAGVPSRLQMKSPVLGQLPVRSPRLKGRAPPSNNAIEPSAGGRHMSRLRETCAGFTLRARTFRSGRSGPSSRLIAVLVRREARYNLHGESPCMERSSNPPLPSVAPKRVTVR